MLTAWDNSNQTESFAYRTAAQAQVLRQMFSYSQEVPKAGRFVLAQARVFRCAFSCNMF